MAAMKSSSSSTRKSCANALTNNAPIHPANNAPIHPANNAPIHPANNATIHPANNAPIHPANNAPIHPASNATIHPASNAAIHPANNAPIHPANNVSADDDDHDTFDFSFDLDMFSGDTLFDDEFLDMTPENVTRALNRPRECFEDKEFAEILASLGDCTDASEPNASRSNASRAVGPGKDIAAMKRLREKTNQIQPTRPRLTHAEKAKLAAKQYKAETTRHNAKSNSTSETDTSGDSSSDEVTVMDTSNDAPPTKTYRKSDNYKGSDNDGSDDDDESDTEVESDDDNESIVPNNSNDSRQKRKYTTPELVEPADMEDDSDDDMEDDSDDDVILVSRATNKRKLTHTEQTATAEHKGIQPPVTDMTPEQRKKRKAGKQRGDNGPNKAIKRSTNGTPSNRKTKPGPIITDKRLPLHVLCNGKFIVVGQHSYDATAHSCCGRKHVLGTCVVFEFGKTFKIRPGFLTGVTNLYSGVIKDASFVVFGDECCELPMPKPGSKSNVYCFAAKGLDKTTNKQERRYQLDKKKIHALFQDRQFFDPRAPYKMWEIVDLLLNSQTGKLDLRDICIRTLIHSTVLLKLANPSDDNPSLGRFMGYIHECFGFLDNGAFCSTALSKNYLDVIDNYPKCVTTGAPNFRLCASAERCSEFDSDDDTRQAVREFGAAIANQLFRFYQQYDLYKTVLELNKSHAQAIREWENLQALQRGDESELATVEESLDEQATIIANLQQKFKEATARANELDIKFKQAQDADERNKISEATDAVVATQQQQIQELTAKIAELEANAAAADAIAERSEHRAVQVRAAEEAARNIATAVEKVSNNLSRYGRTRKQTKRLIDA